MIVRISRVLVLMLALFATQASCATIHPELKAFPAAEEGQTRFVIVLPEKSRAEEAGFKVELIPGKVMMIDGVNTLRHGSSIVAKPLVGWGYTLYEVTGEDLVMGTLMAVPEGVEPVEAFVPGESLTIHYNSRLPIVIYAPDGYGVRYRIWSAAPEAVPAEKH